MELSNNMNLDSQLIELQKEIVFFNKVRLNYENLQKELIGNEHLRHIYEPSAKLLLDRAEEDLAIAFKQIANSYVDIDSVEAVARQTNASTMDVTIETPEKSISGFIEMGLLGKTLNSFQSLIYSIIDPSKGRKKTVIRDAGALAVSAFAPGSFVVRVHEQTNGLIADENLILEKTVPIIGSLMEASEDVAKLKEATSDLELTTVSIYRNFLKTLSSGDSGINIKWVSPSGNKRNHSLSSQQVKNAISLFNNDKSLTSRPITVDGILTMFERDDINNRRNFKLIGFDEVSYSGIVDEKVPGCFVPTNISALIEEQIEVNNTTDEEFIKYILLSVDDSFANDDK
ncbi:MAG: hypothetical protein PHT79_02265 [Syntrophomonadaceae bacterium]|nr:hypothetical protein [Syntrophomonadaceae bacterium]MDD4548568.1 hypothetical protein [Syntrophomonadaceae bacterium]